MPQKSVGHRGTDKIGLAKKNQRPRASQHIMLRNLAQNSKKKKKNPVDVTLVLLAISNPKNNTIMETRILSSKEITAKGDNVSVHSLPYTFLFQAIFVISSQGLQNQTSIQFTLFFFFHFFQDLALSLNKEQQAAKSAAKSPRPSHPA